MVTRWKQCVKQILLGMVCILAGWMLTPVLLDGDATFAVFITFGGGLFILGSIHELYYCYIVRRRRRMRRF